MYESSKLLIVSFTPRDTRRKPASPIQSPPASMPASAIPSVIDDR